MYLKSARLKYLPVLTQGIISLLCCQENIDKLVTGRYF